MAGLPSNMIRLERNDYPAAYELYLKSDFFFPLIAAVMLDQQDGVVYVDNAAAPLQAYVEHAFGFSQVFGSPNADFERELEHYLLVARAFAPQKIRLYAPHAPDFIAATRYEPLRSYRQRFKIDPRDFAQRRAADPASASGVSTGVVDAGNIAAVDQAFGVVSRFWRNTADFIENSQAVVVFRDGLPASICYAAAVANRCAEIDVLTLPEHRAQGLGRLSVMEFIGRCLDSSISPLWDCFTNNEGSMMLCKSAGFATFAPPYPFFTINK